MFTVSRPCILVFMINVLGIRLARIRTFSKEPRSRRISRETGRTTVKNDRKHILRAKNARIRNLLESNAKSTPPPPSPKERPKSTVRRKNNALVRILVVHGLDSMISCYTSSFKVKGLLPYMAHICATYTSHIYICDDASPLVVLRHVRTAVVA